MKMNVRPLMSGLVVGLVATGTLGVAIGVTGPPEAPPVSRLAPAEDLVAQLEEYVEELEESVEEASEYEDSKEKLAKDASTIILIAVGLGLHDQQNQYKAAAAGVVRAARQVAETDDYGSAKAAVAAVRAALAGRADPSGLSWSEKNASMHALMKAVPLVNTRVKRYMRRFQRGADDLAGYSAVLAIIGQGAMPNASDTEKPEEVEKWYRFCARMRDSAAALNAACHAEDETAAKRAMDSLQASCEECHEVFHEKED